MKKQILNLGKALNKAEQKQINGGYMPECYTNEDCNQGEVCHLSSATCFDPNTPLYDGLGCDTNPFTNPSGFGC